MTAEKIDELKEFTNEEPANDIFSEFDELDEISIIEEESPINNFSDLLDEAKAKKDSLNEVTDSINNELDIEEEIDDFNKTKEIYNFKDQILEKLEEFESNTYDESFEKNDLKETKKENREKEETEEDPKPFRTAFIYTSIIGFIILFICYGIYLYLLIK